MSFYLIKSLYANDFYALQSAAPQKVDTERWKTDGK